MVLCAPPHREKVGSARSFLPGGYKPIYIAGSLDYPVPGHTGPSTMHSRYVCLYIWESHPSCTLSRASLLYYGIVPWNKLCKFWNCRCAGWCAYDRLMFWDVACHVPWCCFTIYDVLWRSMLFYDLLNFSIMFYDVPWFPMMIFATIWCPMIFYDVLWCSLTFHDVLWCSMMFHYVLWCSMMFYDLL